MLNEHNALHKIHSLNKKCIIQRVRAHVGINENKTADTLTKEARKLNNDKLPCVFFLSFSTLKDINAVAKSKLKNKAVKLKHQICEINTSRTLGNSLTRLKKKKNLRGMKVQKDGTIRYLPCRNCGSDTELSPEHFFLPCHFGHLTAD